MVRPYHFIAYDVEGLLLELGVDVWFSAYQASLLEATSTEIKVLSTAYKSYMLICAVRGGLPVVVRHLIESNADLYFEQYLPINQPQRRSAASELLALGSQITPWAKDYALAWAEIIYLSPPNTQYMLFKSAFGIALGTRNAIYLKVLDTVDKFDWDCCLCSISALHQIYGDIVWWINRHVHQLLSLMTALAS